MSSPYHPLVSTPSPSASLGSSSSYQLPMGSSFCPMVLFVICMGHRKKFIKNFDSKSSFAQSTKSMCTDNSQPSTLLPRVFRVIQERREGKLFLVLVSVFIFSFKEGSSRNQLAKPLA